MQLVCWRFSELPWPGWLRTSINIIYVRSSEGAKVNPRQHRVRGGTHPGQVTNSSQGLTHRDKQRLRLTFTDMDNFELTCMYFGLWEEASAPGGKTHLDTRRTLNLCDERPQPTGRFQTQNPPAVRRQRSSLHRRASHFIDLEITAVKHEACQWWQSICLDCCFF